MATTNTLTHILPMLRSLSGGALVLIHDGDDDESRKIIWAWNYVQHHALVCAIRPRRPLSPGSPS